MNWIEAYLGKPLTDFTITPEQLNNKELFLWCVFDFNPYDAEEENPNGDFVWALKRPLLSIDCLPYTPNSALWPLTGGLGLESDKDDHPLLLRTFYENHYIEVKGDGPIGRLAVVWPSRLSACVVGTHEEYVRLRKKHYAKT